VLIARFYVVMGMLTVECTYAPDFADHIPLNKRSPVFLGRHYTDFSGLDLNGLTDALYKCLKQSEKRGEYYAVTDWL